MAQTCANFCMKSGARGTLTVPLNEVFRCVGVTKKLFELFGKLAKKIAQCSTATQQSAA